MCNASLPRYIVEPNIAEIACRLTIHRLERRTEKEFYPPITREVTK